MRYLSIWTPSEAQARAPMTPEFMAAMGRLMESETKLGTLVMTGGMFPTSKGGARLKSEGGSIRVLDGPFAEAKEVIAGWAILEAPDLAGAIASCKRFMAVAGDGESELRQILGPGDM